jgi:hypothetical protein
MLICLSDQYIQLNALVNLMPNKETTPLDLQLDPATKGEQHGQE